MKRIIGLDIGGTKCAVLLAHVDSGIHIVERISFPTQTELGYQQAIDRLFDAVRLLMEKHHLSAKDVESIGVSCGGPLDSKRGLILCPPNLPGWINVPITRMLTDAFGVPAYVQNDAKACALVEWKLGAGRGTRNMMFLTMGTGMGSGIIAEGQLVCGACDMGGEVGHIRIEPDGPVGFGKHGSFEGFTSGGGIARLSRQLASDALKNGRPFAFGQTQEAIERLTTKDVAAHARAGDPDAIVIFETVGEKLGKGLSYFIDILNPEVIVIGSIFGRCEELLRPSMEAVLEKECISFSRAACRVVPAQTGESIGDLASIMVALHGSASGLEPSVAPAAQAHLDRLFKRYPALKGCRDAVQSAFLRLCQCFEEGNKLLLCGNGGSAADCEHIVGELMKGFLLARKATRFHADDHTTQDEADMLNGALQGALPAISLTGHPALTSAFANDVLPVMGFAQQVAGLGRRGDVLWGISTSGNSENVIRAMQAARQLGLKTIGLTGATGGRLKGIADVCICVPETETLCIQELHLPVYHALCAALEAQFFGK